MAKRNLWNSQNPILTLKVIVVSIIVGLIGLIPMAIAFWFINQQNMMIVGRILQLGWVIFSLWLWGYLAYKIFKIN